MHTRVNVTAVKIKLDYKILLCNLSVRPSHWKRRVTEDMQWPPEPFGNLCIWYTDFFFFSFFLCLLLSLWLLCYFLFSSFGCTGYLPSSGTEIRSGFYCSSIRYISEIPSSDFPFSCVVMAYVSIVCWFSRCSSTVRVTHYPRVF